MRSIIRDYSYNIVKMFIYQIAIGIFGAMLSMATSAVDNDTLSIVVSVISILFYLFLLYTMTWEIGAKDRISVDVGKKPYRPYLGLVLALFANIPNFLIAILYAICFPFMGTQEWAGNVNSLVKIVSLVLEGMYSGLTSKVFLTVGEALRPLHYFWWIYFLLPIPAILTIGASYLAGHKNSRFGALFAGPKPEQGKEKK